MSVAQLTANGNKVLFTKQECLLLSPSANLNEGIIIEARGPDSLYRLKQNLTKPNKHKVLRTQMDSRKSDEVGKWKIAKRKTGTRVAPAYLMASTPMTPSTMQTRR